MPQRISYLTRAGPDETILLLSMREGRINNGTVTDAAFSPIGGVRRETDRTQCTQITCLRRALSGGRVLRRRGGRKCPSSAPWRDLGRQQVGDLRLPHAGTERVARGAAREGSGEQRVTPGRAHSGRRVLFSPLSRRYRRGFDAQRSLFLLEPLRSGSGSGTGG